MMLAHMLAEDRAAVICDFAETYHVYDIHTLPASLAATLACGLSADSRIMRKLAGVEVSPPFLLIAAAIMDELTALRYQIGADENTPKPHYLLDTILGGSTDRGAFGFDTAEEYEAARQKIIERALKNG